MHHRQRPTQLEPACSQAAMTADSTSAPCASQRTRQAIGQPCAEHNAPVPGSVIHGIGHVNPPSHSCRAPATPGPAHLRTAPQADGASPAEAAMPGPSRPACWPMSGSAPEARISQGSEPVALPTPKPRTPRAVRRLPVDMRPGKKGPEAGPKRDAG